jgi:hypothetical protein
VATGRNSQQQDEQQFFHNDRLYDSKSSERRLASPRSAPSYVQASCRNKNPGRTETVRKLRARRNGLILIKAAPPRDRKPGSNR